MSMCDCCVAFFQTGLICCELDSTDALYRNEHKQAQQVRPLAYKGATIAPVHDSKSLYKHPNQFLYIILLDYPWLKLRIVFLTKPLYPFPSPALSFDNYASICSTILPKSAGSCFSFLQYLFVMLMQVRNKANQSFKNQHTLLIRFTFLFKTGYR